MKKLFLEEFIFYVKYNIDISVEARVFSKSIIIDFIEHISDIDKVKCIELLGDINGCIFINENDPEIKLFIELDSKNIFKVIGVSDNFENIEEYEWLENLIKDHFESELNLKINEVSIF